MSYISTIEEAARYDYPHLPGELLPISHEGIFQLWMTEKFVSRRESTIMGHRQGEFYDFDIDREHLDVPIRVHTTSSYEVERFTHGTTGETNAIVTDDGWFEYQSYEDIEGGYRLHMIDAWREPYTYDAFYEERLDRGFIMHYFTHRYAKDAEMALRNLTGHTREDPMYMVLDASEGVPSMSLARTMYFDWQQSLTNVPDVRPSFPWIF